MSALNQFLASNPDTAEKSHGDAMAASLSKAFPCSLGGDEAPTQFPVLHRTQREMDRFRIGTSKSPELAFGVSD
jgi:hypothetical protein